MRFCNALSRACGWEEAYSIGKGKKPNVSCNSDAHGFRLPTEAEWECAAKAGQDFKYSGSDDPDEVAWHRGNSGSSLRSVGQKKPNAWGLYDMSGNVWEWCWDRYGPYDARTRVDPVGPGAGANRVKRGGAWNLRHAYARVAERDWYTPSSGWRNLGFRLART